MTVAETSVQAYYGAERLSRQRCIQVREFIEANPRRWVAGLREGCMLRYEEGRLELIGNRPMRMFRKGIEPFEVQPGDDLSFLL